MLNFETNHYQKCKKKNHLVTFGTKTMEYTYVYKYKFIVSIIDHYSYYL